MTTLSAQPALTPDQVREFDERGYVILPAIFSAAEIAEMAREADRLLALCINASLAVGKPDPRLDVSCAEDAGDVLNVRKLQPVKDLSQSFERFSEDERFLGPMRQIMGCAPILMEEKLNYKQKVACPQYLDRFQVRHGDDRFFLHHDWGYYRQQGYPSETLSSAISIDQTTPENGPIRVIPGTHKQEWPMRDPDPSHGNGIVADGLFEDDDRVDIIAPAGSVMVFHSRLLHDSKPNRTSAPRRLMIYSHYPGTHTFEEDARNRWGRRAGREVEDLYRQMVATGEYSDEFRL